MNLEEDVKQALSNNAQIIAARDVSSGGTTSGGANKQITMADLSLFWALETYQWGKEGILTLDSR